MLHQIFTLMFFSSFFVHRVSIRYIVSNLNGDDLGRFGAKFLFYHLKNNWLHKSIMDDGLHGEERAIVAGPTVYSSTLYTHIFYPIFENDLGSLISFFYVFDVGMNETGGSQELEVYARNWCKSIAPGLII